MVCRGRVDIVYQDTHLFTEYRIIRLHGPYIIYSLRLWQNKRSKPETLFPENFYYGSRNYTLKSIFLLTSLLRLPSPKADLFSYHNNLRHPLNPLSYQKDHQELSMFQLLSIEPHGRTILPGPVTRLNNPLFISLVVTDKQTLTGVQSYLSRYRTLWGSGPVWSRDQWGMLGLYVTSYRRIDSVIARLLNLRSWTSLFYLEVYSFVDRVKPSYSQDERVILFR